MSEALAEVEWIRGLFEELTYPKFSIVEWAAWTFDSRTFVGRRSEISKSFVHWRCQELV